MRKTIRWIVLAVIALIIIGAIAGGSKHSSTSHSTSSPAVAPPVTTIGSSAAQASPSGKQATTSGVPKSGRCGDITVNEHTSCAFAQIVVKAYDAHPSTTFLARSPVTGLTYTMNCKQSQGVVACDDNSTSTLAFSGPPPRSSAEASAATQETSTPSTSAQTTESVEGPGSLSHATDAEFCSTHECIENFPNGSGYIVQCADGEWSHSGGHSGACSDHGGEG